MGPIERDEPHGILGNPDGHHWAAYAPDDHVPEKTDVLDIAVSGDSIRFMSDYGVQIPLWDREGLLPEEPEWLREVLHISEELIADMAAWGERMNRLDGDPALRTEQAWAEMNRRGRVLADRLQVELGSRFTVSYKRW